MANTIKHKRGSGSDPSASDLAVGELAIRTDTGVVFTKKDDGTVAEISGGGQTNLGVSTTTTAVTVTSDTGNNATISEASGSAAGVMSVAHHDKLDGIATGATANSTESIQDIVGGMVSGNSESGISVTYQDSDGTLDFSVTSQTDNNFTTTLKNKLDGIEANATADQSASEILTLIKTVDGSGSGLDADTLDGVSSGSLLRSDAADTKTSGDLTFNDSVKAVFGTGSDLEIYHDGTNSSIENATGDLYIQGQGDDVIIRAADDILIQPQNGENGIKVIGNGEVELFYDNVKKFDTKSDGCEVIGELQCDSLDVDGDADITGTTTLHGNLDLQDLDRILLGTGDDLQILHDGAQSYLAADDLRIVNNAITETQAIFLANGAVSLYHNNSKKFDTKSDGVDITGELQCDSLDVDGAANITGNLDIDENIRHNGDTNNYIGFPAADTFRVVTGGTERVRITSTGALAIEGSSNYGTSGQVLTSNGNDAPTWQDGGGTVADGCVYENSQTISNNYTVSTNKNAMSAGPITVNSGVTITVPSGSTYTVI